MKKSASMKRTAPKLSVYETVTNRIIESLKTGVIPWAKPWQGKTTGGPFPTNFLTGAPYRGINILLLWGSPYSSNQWLTFKQAQELGGSVRKGEKGTQIVFWKKLSTAGEEQPTSPTDTATEERSRFLSRAYTVFNVEQCDGLPAAAPIIIDRPQIDTDDVCESIVTGWENRPTLALDNEHEGRAYYRPSMDAVHMPTRNRFVDAPHYYSTLFHELIHSTGHETRLARTFGACFGDDLYCKEELIAETGASFLGALAGISTEATERNTTAYIQNWIKALEGDHRLMITAAAAAQKAVDTIIGTRFEEEDGSQEPVEQAEGAEVGGPASEVFGTLPEAA